MPERDRPVRPALITGIDARLFNPLPALILFPTALQIRDHLTGADPLANP
jgi:hypothetical protein